MQKTSSKELQQILGNNQNIKNTHITNIVTDSRQAQKSAVFIAIKGEKLDGHDFVEQAIKNGAELVIVERLIPNIPQDLQIVVKNTLTAYGQIATHNRKQFNGVVIGLTGSSGKTTSKEQIKDVLSQYGKVYASSGNFNNHIGVPYTLCNLDMQADYAIIEMGMSSKGEIFRLTNMVNPDIAIVNNVYPMHIEFFENFEAIAHAKAEIFDGLKKEGIAIINEDTNFANVLEDEAKSVGAKLIKYGKNNHYAKGLNLLYNSQIAEYNAWLTLKVVEVLNLDLDKAVARINSFEPLAGRGKISKISLPFGGEFSLIDDSYSGQPEAMKIAIKNLDSMPCKGRKIAVLGKMAELGGCSKDEHIAIGKLLAKSKIDIVVGIKPEMKDMLAQLPQDIEQHYFANIDNLDDFLLNKLLQNNDILLIKGARYSSELYKVAQELLQS